MHLHKPWKPGLKTTLLNDEKKEWIISLINCLLNYSIFIMSLCYQSFFLFTFIMGFELTNLEILVQQWGEEARILSCYTFKFWAESIGGWSFRTVAPNSCF